MSQRARAGLAALALLLQCVVLYAPRAPQVGTGGLPMDKLVHITAFALPTVALVAAGAPRGMVIALMAGNALFSELVQDRLLAERSGDVADVVADLVGVAIGAYLTRGGRLVPATSTRRSRWP